MAALSQTLLKELAAYYHCEEGLPTLETIEYLKTFHPLISATNQDWIKVRWDRLTEKERRIFQSPESYCNVISEWYRSSKKE